MENQPSLPKEFENTLSRKLGDAYPHFLVSLRQSSPVSIRLNTHKTFHIEGDQVAWSTTGKYLPVRPVFTLDPAFHAGAYYVQEASSMFLEQAVNQTVDLNRPVRALDLCAAPGGKSTHLLSLVHPESLVVSNEVIRSRAFILSENIQKWGHANVLVTNKDPEDFSSLHGFFDLIVVDAPCSGEGLFRKDPEAVTEWSPANVELCSKRQRRILADIWPALKTDGILIYCTCTYNEQENEENIKWLKQQQNIESVQLKFKPSWGVEEIQEKEIFGYRFYPHKVKGEGFFLSVIRKKEEQQELKLKLKRGLPTPPKKTIELVKPLTAGAEFQYYTHTDMIYGVPSVISSEVEFLIQQLKIIHAGTPLATLKHEKLIPEHAAALSVRLNKDHFQQSEVNLESALQYLRKEPIQISASKGYSLITYKDLALGWVNVLDNRANNLYPKEWRIRMAG